MGHPFHRFVSREFADKMGHSVSGTLHRFLWVGGFCTALHYLILLVLVEAAEVNPVIASAFGFGISAAANYAASHRITFKSDLSHKMAIPRFLVMITAGLVLNTIAMSLAIHLSAPYFFAQMIATGMVVIFNFLVGLLWVFPADRVGAGYAHK